MPLFAIEEADFTWFRVSLGSCGCWGHRNEVKGIEELDAQEQAVPALQSQWVTRVVHVTWYVVPEIKEV